MSYQHECPQHGAYETNDPEAGGCPYCDASRDFVRKKTVALHAVDVGAAARATGIFSGTGQSAIVSETGAMAKPVRAHTTSVYGELGQPVVGWLVLISGADAGRDFRINAGRNLIGRDAGCAISLTSDPAVSARQAFIAFDPRSLRFSLSPGDGSALTYLNGEALLESRPLAAFDRIEAGKSTLLFIPFCGEKFSWPL